MYWTIKQKSIGPPLLPSNIIWTHQGNKKPEVYTAIQWLFSCIMNSVCLFYPLEICCRGLGYSFRAPHFKNVTALYMTIPSKSFEKSSINCSIRFQRKYNLLKAVLEMQFHKHKCFLSWKEFTYLCWSEIDVVQALFPIINFKLPFTL